MTRRAATLPFALSERASALPAYRWLYSALRTEILNGRIRPGTRLPSTRDFAREYGLSRGTIVRAFEELRSEGYVSGTIGSGTFVSPILPDTILNAGRPGRAEYTKVSRPRRVLSKFAGRVSLFPESSPGGARAFRPNSPAIDLFPTGLWAQIAAKRLRRATTSDLSGCVTFGFSPLRAAVADYLTSARGVKCVPAQVVINSGVQESLDLVTRLLIDPRERVCMEDPGYIGAALAFEAAGARISALRVDGEGMIVPGSRLHQARLAYATPAHQFPLGISMSLRRRLALLTWARENSAMIFEDDYDSEYRYSGRPVPALQGLDQHGVVIFAGTFSKVLFPSIRLGYLVVPEDMIDLVAAAKSVASRHAPVLEQAVLCDFIIEGHFGRHVRRMREVYAERLSVLLESARAELAGLIEISGVEAGLQTVGWLGPGLDDHTSSQVAAARGVEVTALGRYYRGKAPRQGLHLGFAGVNTHDIRIGVQTLAAALQSVRGAKV